MKIGTLDVARIGLGTNRLRRDGAAFVRAAVDAGIQVIDTAHLYTGGDSERAIGAALSPAPPDCLVATKGGYGGPGRGRPEVLRAEIEQSLESLRTDRIGLYYLHRVDPQTPIEDSIGAIKEYVDAGKIALVGLSQVDVGQIERAQRIVPIAAVQNHYNLVERRFDPVIDWCTAHDIPFLPYFPLSGHDRPAACAIAARHGVTTPQIALAWLLRRSPVMLPIPGTRSLDHVRENLAALHIELTDAEYEALR